MSPARSGRRRPGPDTAVDGTGSASVATRSAGAGAGVGAGAGAGLRSIGWVAAAVVAAGVLVNVYLAAIARSTSAAEYAYFGSFWSLALVVGLGVFLPVEQEAARLSHRTGGRLPSGVASTAAALGAVLLVLVLAGWPALDRALGGDRAAIAALAALCVVSAGQFVLRGSLIGGGRLAAHAGVMLLDAVLRVLLCLGVAVAVTDPGVGAFAWTLVVAIAASHAPGLVRLARERHHHRPDLSAGGAPDAAPLAPTAASRAAPSAPAVGARAAGAPEVGAADVTAAAVRRAVVPLLLGSLCAQVLLNGPPLAAAALAGSEAEATRAGQFVGAFTLARMPVFLAVPLQTALLPALLGVLQSGDVAALRRLVGRISAAVAVLGVLAVAAGGVLGPTMVELVLGDRYRSDRDDVALLALGVVLYIGQVLMTQVLVAAEHHRLVAASWLCGVAVGLVVLLAVPEVATAAELGFLAGSAVGWVLSTGLVLRRA